MAVHTHITSQQAQEFLSSYEVGTLRTLKGVLQGVENTTYVVRTTKDDFILTLYEKRTDKKDLPFFLSLMSHLAHQGIRCPVPVPQKNGDFLGHLAGRPAALVTFLEGTQAVNPSCEECAQVGAALAHLHKNGASFPVTRANTLGLSAWTALLEESRHAISRPGLYEEIAREIESLETGWPHHLPMGVIHGDFFPDNVLFAKRLPPGIIDFYFSCTELFAYDLAIAVNAWCFDEQIILDLRKVQALVGGYETQRRLSVEEKEALPMLLRGAAVRFLLTRLNDWGVATPSLHPRDPLEYAHRLAHHRSLASLSAYGLSV